MFKLAKCMMLPRESNLYNEEAFPVITGTNNDCECFMKLTAGLMEAGTVNYINPALVLSVCSCRFLHNARQRCFSPGIKAAECI